MAKANNGLDPDSFFFLYDSFSADRSSLVFFPKNLNFLSLRQI
jgi:hypothetical protein